MSRALASALLLVAACAPNPSVLDSDGKDAKAKQHDSKKGPPPSDTKDPWAKPVTDGTVPDAVANAEDNDKGGALGGFDLKAVYDKIKSSIEKPGRFEAPEKSAGYDSSQPHWGVLEMSGKVVERSAFSFTGGGGTELRSLVGRMRSLATDSKLTGLVVRLDKLEISMPDAVELRAAMHDFRAAGKKLYCHTEAATTGTYLLAAACDKIALAPLGEVMIPGPAAMPIHVKGLLDKVGVDADFLHVGAYKGAAEPLTREAPSEEMKQTLDAILQRRYDSTVDIIAKERGLDAAKVKELIDTAMFPAPDAKAAKLVDDVVAFEAFRDGAAGGGAWTNLDVDPDKKDPVALMLKGMRFFGAVPQEDFGPHVAVVYAVGNIVDGGGEGILGARGEIASHTLVAALHALAVDDNVKAVVLRVDSGGGSAQASELIWGAMQELKAKKPVVVSMSDVAASGGYYISAGATKIYALEDTLTGSIGVVGGKLAPARALANLGVQTYPMGKGKRATMWASLNAWSADEKAAVQATMNAVYEVFVSRVAAGRGKTPEDVKKVAEGRVWVGSKAKELGLVDEIGGLDAALAEAKKLGKVDASSSIEVYPNTPTLRDILHGYGMVQTPVGLGGSAALDEIALVDPIVGAEAKRLLELVLSFREASVQTVSILPVIR